MPESNLLSIHRHTYTAASGTISSLIYWQTISQTPAQFCDATATAVDGIYTADPPTSGSTCLTLNSWISGGVPQDAITVCKEQGETVEEFVDRAKRVFKAALDQHQPD